MFIILTIAASLFGNLFAQDFDFESLYRIENDTLINFEGKVYPRIPFKDDLHQDLCYILKDPQQAAIIHQAYLEEIVPNFSEEVLPSFKIALLKVCLLFGAEKFSPENALLAALQEDKSAANAICKNNKHCISSFVAKANRPAAPNITSKNDLFTVVTLSTSAAGGNLSVANSIHRFLSTQKGIRSIVVDVEEIAKNTDPVMLATNATTYDQIYMDYFQMANRGLDVIHLSENLTKNIEQYIPSRFGLKLKELIRELKPDLILSTRNYTHDDITLCTLGAAFRMVHCDYELGIKLMDLYGKIEPQMMKCWLPTLHPRAFKPLFLKTNRMDLYDENDGREDLFKKIAIITEQSEENIADQFELLDYPTFFRADQDCKVDCKEICILICMGKNGVGVLSNIFDELLTHPISKYPVKYHIVCGRNEALLKNLETKAKGDPQFVLHGLLSATEMNDLMNQSDILISKPGGATVSEALITGTYQLIMHTYPWEEANCAVLERNGLGQKIQMDQPLSQQIEECIEARACIKRKNPQENHWQEQLMGYINLNQQTRQ